MREKELLQSSSFFGGMKMEKSVLFFDIDGTILSEITKEVPKSTVDALKKAKENGHILFINTGRTYSSIPKLIKELPFDGFVCGCGIYILYKGNVLYEKHISVEQAEALFQKADECMIDGIYESDTDVFFTRRKSRFAEVERVRKEMASVKLGINRYLEDGKCLFDKMYLCTDEKSNVEEYLEFAKKEMDVIDRENGAYELMPKGHSKGTAIEYVRKVLNIDEDNSYVFGDSSNDLAMFKAVPHTIAMGKHSEVLEPYTEFVTKEVEANGIEFALKHYGLI